MLAPKITPSAWGKVSSPAPTKPTAVTVTALDDCSTAVAAAPVAAPPSGVRVNRASARRSAGPESPRRLSVIQLIPSRNRPSPPSA